MSRHPPGRSQALNPVGAWTSDGQVGVWTHLGDTPSAYVRNVRALVDVISVDHVCIGTDTKLTQPSFRPMGPGRGAGGPPAWGTWPGPRVGERTNLAWHDQTAGFYYVVADAMLRTRFTADED
jgi:membrane dipeptidase